MNRQQMHYLREGFDQFLSEAEQMLDLFGKGDSKIGNYNGHRSADGGAVPMPDPTLDPWQIIKQWLLHWYNLLKQIFMA